MAEELVKLLVQHVNVGEPLPFDVLDIQSRLLLRKGSVVASEGQLERLLERGLYLAEAEFAAHFGKPDERCAPDVAPAVLESAWGRLLALQARLAPWLAALGGDEGAGPDSEVAGAGVATALAMNVAMRVLQDTLYAQREPLNESQKAAIHSHPTRAAQLLRAAEVTDEACLAVVARHHEHADGTGYPARLTAPAVDLGCQAVALADRYCALIAKRAYRDGAPPDQALKLLRDRVGSTFDPVVVRQLVNEVGDYPPGCPVRLVNNESGIVISRTRDPSSRVVKALRSALNAVYEDGPRRLTGQPAYAVDRVIPLSELAIDIDPTRLWGETARVGLR